jgi:type I restriction enzyme M protein
MASSRDVSSELKTFNSLFNIMARKYEASTIFDDLLSIFICCFARGTQEKWYFEIISRYEKEELNTFAKMMAELLIIYSDGKNKNEWIDPLGEYYEVLASNNKKSSFGQFFTPKAVCDLMSALVLQNADWDNKINDCACGSGRTLLSANKFIPDMYHIGQDIDMICAKMTAINLCMHQIKGEVHCMDTLKMTTPRKSFIINPKFYEHKTLLILVA